MGTHEHHLHPFLLYEYILWNSNEVNIYKKHKLQYEFKSRIKPCKEPWVGQPWSSDYMSVFLIMLKRNYLPGHKTNVVSGLLSFQQLYLCAIEVVIAAFDCGRNHSCLLIGCWPLSLDILNYTAF